MRTITAVTAWMTEARRMPAVGVVTSGNFPSGAGATIAVEVRVDRNFSQALGPPPFELRTTKFSKKASMGGEPPPQFEVE